MNEYKKKLAELQAGQLNKESAAPVQAKTNGIPNSVLNDVFAGKRHADSSMMGHSQNLAPSIAAKMSRAFGMDLTGMQVYQSDAMKDTGMQGMAQGNKVVLSSDVDLNTTAGQAVLGHEISHIHAQSQGIGMGHSGLYENAALEHQADTEGLLAAQGRSIYSDGMDTGIGMQYGLGMQGVEGLTPLSGGMSASAGAPMQAFGSKNDPGGLFGRYTAKPKSNEDAQKLANSKTDEIVKTIIATRDENKLDPKAYRDFTLEKYGELYKYIYNMKRPEEEEKDMKEDMEADKKEGRERTKLSYYDDWTKRLIRSANGGMGLSTGYGKLSELLYSAENAYSGLNVKIKEENKKQEKKENGGLLSLFKKKVEKDPKKIFNKSGI